MAHVINCMVCLHCVLQDKAMLETTGSEQPLESKWAHGKLGQHSVYSAGNVQLSTKLSFFTSCGGFISKLCLCFPIPVCPALLSRTLHSGCTCTVPLPLFSSPLPLAAIRTTQPCSLGTDIILQYQLRVLESALEPG